MVNRSRRALLVGTAVTLVLPRPLGAQSALEQHRPLIDAPSLSEDPTAVPIQVSVAHPMEPEHFIRSIEITLDNDPVPYKGKFLFTPANGQALVAFAMRSGAGGALKAIAECSKHGPFVATKEIRVVEGGCANPPDVTDRSRLGNPRIRLPATLRPGQVVQVRAKVDHTSHTGLALKSGRYMREGPEFYVKQMLVFLDGEKISEFQMSPAVTANPLIRFPLRVPKSGTLRVVFVNNEGQRWEASQPIRV